MRRTKAAANPSIDVMESRLLLSTAAPLLSKPELAGVVREVRGIMTILGKTGDTAQANTQLAELSAQIPSASAQLALAWQIDLGLYRPHSARSLATAQTRILSDLYRVDRAGVVAGNPPVNGSGSTTSNHPSPGSGSTIAPLPTPTPTPTPTLTPSPTPTPVRSPSMDSVKIQNTTGVAIVVTVFLNESEFQQPSITETIPANGNAVATFDFGTATGDFMTMDVRPANGVQSPSPSTNVSLSQPLGGYDGLTFTISLLGPYFTVNVP